MHDTHPLFYLWVSFLSHVVVTVSALLASLSVHMPVFPSVCLFVCLSACLPICLCVILSVCLSVCLQSWASCNPWSPRFVNEIRRQYFLFLFVLFAFTFYRRYLPVDSTSHRWSCLRRTLPNCFTLSSVLLFLCLLLYLIRRHFLRPCACVCINDVAQYFTVRSPY